ncbi:MAG: 30S ribosomal protein S6 [Phycisphaerae bacterium]|nr:30S ribosomal protein S6 [Phycisphaerae bacterium]
MKTYEGMFLLDAGNPDFQAACEPVRTILGRYQAQVLSMKPWEERRLAFEISGRKRGLYVLTYFQAEPGVLTEIEHDCRLEERILRALILRKDKVSEDVINADTPATAPRREPEPEAPAPEDYADHAERRDDDN